MSFLAALWRLDREKVTIESPSVVAGGRTGRRVRPWVPSYLGYPLRARFPKTRGPFWGNLGCWDAGMSLGGWDVAGMLAAARAEVVSEVVYRSGNIDREFFTIESPSVVATTPSARYALATR